MKKAILLLLTGGIYASGFAQVKTGQTELHIIPEPVSVTVHDGYFQLRSNTAVVAEDPAARDVAGLFMQMLNTPTGYHLLSREDRAGNGNAIIVRINHIRDPVLGSEGYTLRVTSKNIIIAANQPNGIFNGMQTLMQLLPPDVESRTEIKSMKWDIPCVSITDFPRFGWRGLMLDVSRHFFSKEFVEKYIDEMAKYKYNVFHWHLADDQGWRIEIKGLPKLTETGAWRVPRMGKWWSFLPPQPGEKATQGGFYTQQDILEVVAYAKKRFITILPEIDVPGHSLSLIAAYPNLSCTQLQYPVNPGSLFYKIEDNALCVANVSTWSMLDKIFTQVAELFPCPYIHVGGDEAYSGFWAKCPKDQELMKEEKITDLDGLQSYFEKKLEKLITSKGKKMIGWDDILDGGIAPEATVMSWRGMSGGTKAAKLGHQVIMTPSNFAYLDLYQGDPLVEPETYSMLRLNTCYQFEPVPDGVDPKYILGGQGNLWTESVPNDRQAEYMTWPRAMALAEVFWSPKDKRNWKDFLTREQYRFNYMDVARVKYARSQYDAIISGVKGADDSLEVELSTQMPGLKIYYRFDETNPDNFSPEYDGRPLVIPKGASGIKVITYRDGKPIGQQINCPLSEVRKRKAG